MSLKRSSPVPSFSSFRSVDSLVFCQVKEMERGEEMGRGVMRGGGGGMEGGGGNVESQAYLTFIVYCHNTR